MVDPLQAPARSQHISTWGVFGADRYEQTERLAPLGLLGGTAMISILKSNKRTA
jgi:hypothetical protein